MIHLRKIGKKIQIDYQEISMILKTIREVRIYIYVHMKSNINVNQKLE